MGFGGTTRQRQGRFASFHLFVRFRFGNIESFQTVSEDEFSEVRTMVSKKGLRSLALRRLVSL